MFGKLSLDAVPFHEPIVMVTIAGIILGGLALVGLITYFGKWTYLWKEWLTSVDHKRLGIMYIIVAIVMLLRGFADAIMMRSQQALASAGEAGFLPPHHYDQIFTAHGVIMIFFVAMPFVIGLMNLVVPLQIGARDVAFPRSRLQAKFGGQEFLIGLDPALLLGHTAVVSASLIFIPLTILIAVCVPGNQVLPFGDLATIGFFVAMAVAVHRGNLFRTLISGVIIMSITLWIATQTIGLHTQLAANAGALKAGGMVASMDQGGSPITWLLIQVFSPQNIPGFIIIGAIYLTGIFMTWRRARGFIKQEKVVLAE